MYVRVSPTQTSTMNSCRRRWTFSPSHFTNRCNARWKKKMRSPKEGPSWRCPISQHFSVSFRITTKWRMRKPAGIFCQELRLPLWCCKRCVNTISQSPTMTRPAGSGIKGFKEFFDYADKMSPLGNASTEACADYCVVMFSDLVTLYAKPLSRRRILIHGNEPELTSISDEKIINIFLLMLPVILGAGNQAKAIGPLARSCAQRFRTIRQYFQRGVRLCGQWSWIRNHRIYLRNTHHRRDRSRTSFRANAHPGVGPAERKLYTVILLLQMPYLWCLWWRRNQYTSNHWCLTSAGYGHSRLQ